MSVKYFLIFTFLLISTSFAAGHNDIIEENLDSDEKQEIKEVDVQLANVSKLAPERKPSILQKLAGWIARKVTKKMDCDSFELKNKIEHKESCGSLRTSLNEMGAGRKLIGPAVVGELLDQAINMSDKKTLNEAKKKEEQILEHVENKQELKSEIKSVLKSFKKEKHGKSLKVENVENRSKIVSMLIYMRNLVGKIEEKKAIEDEKNESSYAAHPRNKRGYGDYYMMGFGAALAGFDWVTKKVAGPIWFTVIPPIIIVFGAFFLGLAWCCVVLALAVPYTIIYAVLKLFGLV